jgi:hypothetical protein
MERLRQHVSAQTLMHQTQEWITASLVTRIVSGAQTVQLRDVQNVKQMPN